MELNDGLYMPPDLVLGRHVFFGFDNVDFAEDTPDGKNTFHCTAMAIYQRQEPGDVAPELTVDLGDQCRKACCSYLPPAWIVYRRPTSAYCT